MSQPRDGGRIVLGAAAAFLLGAAALGVAAFVARDPVIPERDVAARPIEVHGGGYVASTACQACHPAQHEAWLASFHRTMTQVATPTTVEADFDGVQVDAVHGRPMRLERRGDEFWAEFDDPGWEGPDAERPRIRRQVVLITGSHHQQIYWYATGHDRVLNVLPGVYLLDERRWVPRSMVVLHPPNQRVAMLDGAWNAICIVCHTTNGQTRFDSPYRSKPIATQGVDTRVAEFGIACEACHGPGEQHVAANRNPLRRYLRHLTDRPDPTVVLPTRLDGRRGSQVCGQCHSVWEFYEADDEREAARHGLAYRPGDELTETRFVAQPSRDRSSPAMQALLADPEYVRGAFWPDGMIRVSGREYNGLIDSPCFAKATDPARTLSCFSCHTMHKTPDDPRPLAAWARDQISAGMEGNAACTQCHDAFATDVAAHTRHAPDSTGSLCYNCHMPYTSYGLLKALRSHAISSPSVAATLQTGRPNACNLCHLDQTLAWTAERLSEWYGTPEVTLSEDEREVAASLLSLLKGDAGQRAITAWSMGWTPAQHTSGTGWMVPFLTELMNDQYDAVRFIAHRSLRSLPGFGDVEYDYAAPARERVGAALRALQRWRASPLARERPESELLFEPDGSLMVDRMKRLFGQRDTRPLFLRE